MIGEHCWQGAGAWQDPVGGVRMVSSKRFCVDIDGDVTVVRLNDPKLYEMILITELHDELLQYIEHHQPKKLLVDFAMVTQCSSAVINSMLMARKRLHSRGAVMMLCSMHKQVRDAFRVLRLDGTLFEIYESLPEGLEAFVD
jgi:anti-anti-sigma regulatory factor